MTTDTPLREGTGSTASRVEPVTAFVHELSYDEIPPSVVEQARRLLLDLCGVAAAGSTTAMSRIARDHVADYSAVPGRSARMLFDGRWTSPIGAAFAGAATLDSFDAHDGHNLTRGHAGAAVLPALLAIADTRPETDGRELLTSLVLGFEIATRSGLALHTVAAEYHASGAWNALGAATVAARLLELPRTRTGQALGVAEYHAPRGLMMNCIDHPSMVKDSSAAGAATGVSASLLAARGYTAPPARVLTDEATTRLWDDLGERWRITEQYLKLFPVCRWAHPAISAVLDLRAQHAPRGADTTEVDHLEVSTFDAATRLATRHPDTTEQAQYSLPFPVAVAFVHGEITPAHLDDPRQVDPEVRRLAATMRVEANPSFEQRYPAELYARVDLVLTDGSRLSAQTRSAPGGPENPLTDLELRTKYHSLTRGVLTVDRAAAIERAVAALPDEAGPGRTLIETLLGDDSG